MIVEVVIDRLFEQAVTGKPIKVKTETFNTILLSEFDLFGLGVAVKQVVVTEEVVWHMGLIVAFELWLCWFDVGPFCKALTPPLIVFWNGVKLRQVKGDNANCLFYRRDVWRQASYVLRGFDRVIVQATFT